MGVLPLTIEKQEDASFAFRFNLLGESREFTAPPILPDTGLEAMQDTGPQAFLEALMPPGLCDALRQWELAHQGKLTLAIIESPTPSTICWEMIPAVAGLHNVMIARIGTSHEGVGYVSAPGDGCRLLAAGWADLGHYRLTGIDQEMTDMARLKRKGVVQVSALIDLSIEDFTRAYRNARPQLLHLASVSAVGTRLCMGISEGEPLMVEAEALAAHLQINDFVPNVITLNCCDTDQFAAALQARIPCTTVGWIGLVDDLTAGDFTAVFYTKLLEGCTVVDAMRAFDWKILGPSVLPVIWYPSLAHIASRLFKVGHETPEISVGVETIERPSTSYQASADGSMSAAEQPFGGKWSTPFVQDRDYTVPRQDHTVELEARIDMELVVAINPALLTNGKPVIKRLAINVNQPINDATLTLSCDTGKQRSSVCQMHDINAGRLSIRRDCIHFPALYELIDTKVGRRMINITASLEVAGKTVVHITQAVLWMACDEWMDHPDTWSYVPAFVLPHSAGVQTVLDSAIGILTARASPNAAFDGYQSGDAKYVMEQVEVVFNTLRTELRLSYINPPGSPVYTRGEQQAQGQKVRLCDEVINLKRGTCHDLALVFAGVIEHVGIHPLVILVKGHTFFGFWTDATAHAEFWTEANANILKRPSEGRKGWVISDRNIILRLQKDNRVCLVESTYVTNRNGSFDAACHEALRRMDAFDCAIDVAQSRREVQPMG